MKNFWVLILIFCCFSVNAQRAPEKKYTYEEYIEMYRDIAVREMLAFKIPASITLAQGLLESGAGNSELAVNANNHFGIKCHNGWTGPTYLKDDDNKDDCFRKYDNPEESYKDHSDFLSRHSRYASLFELKITDYKEWARGLKKAGYATNPRYADLLIDMIERYELFQYDTCTIIPGELLKAEKGQTLAEIAATYPYPEPKEKPADTNKSVTKTDNPVSQEEFGPLQMGNQGRKSGTMNGIRFTIAKKGDSFRSIADDFEMLDWQIARYNDLTKQSKLKAGQIIYLQPKKRKADAKKHIAKSGDSLHSISQHYGIKLKLLYKLNNMEEGDQPETGQTIYLRKHH